MMGTRPLASVIRMPCDMLASVASCCAFDCARSARRNSSRSNSRKLRRCMRSIQPRTCNETRIDAGKNVTSSMCSTSAPTLVIPLTPISRAAKISTDSMACSGHPAQRDVRHDRRGEDREHAGEQIAFGVLPAREAREISGDQEQRERRNENQQALRPDRPLSREQRGRAKIDRRQNEAARDDRLGQVSRHHQRVDPDAQEVDQRDPVQPVLQAAAAAAPCRGLVAPPRAWAAAAEFGAPGTSAVSMLARSSAAFAVSVLSGDKSADITVR